MPRRIEQTHILRRVASVQPAAVAAATWTAFRGAARRRMLEALAASETRADQPVAEALAQLERKAGRDRVVEQLAVYRGLALEDAAELLSRWEQRADDDDDDEPGRDARDPGTPLTDAERLVEIRLSSEYPVERWFGLEILDHGPDSVRLGRLVDGAPLLWGHSPNDPIGVIESVALTDRVLRIVARFGRGQDAEQRNRDVLDGILRNASVGYILHELRTEVLSDDGPDTYRATDWEPIEGSLVSIGADPTAGPNRSFAAHPIVITGEDPTMPREQDPAGGETATVTETRAAGAAEPAAALETRAAEDASAALDQAERHRRRQIRAIAESYPADPRVQASALEALDTGRSLADFQSGVAELLRTEPEAATERPATEIGLTEREARSWSLLRWARACLAAQAGKDPRAVAPFEFECSDAVEDACRRASSERRETQGTLVGGTARHAVAWTRAAMRAGEPAGPSIERLLQQDVPEDQVRLAARVPLEVQAMFLQGTPGDLARRAAARAALGLTHRAPPMDTAGSAGLVGTDHLAGSFIDALREMAMIFRAGATELPGLVGNVSIPRQSGLATFTWVAEDGDSIDTETPIDAVVLSPKTLTGSVPITRRLLLQSAPPVEGIVREDLTRGAAEGIDNAAINGAGTNEPLGIVNQTGVQVVTVATPGQPTWAEIVAFEVALLEQNGLQTSPSWFLSPSTMGHCKSTPMESGDSRMMIADNGPLNGYAWQAGPQVQEGSGNNFLIFGAAAEVLVGMWGVLDLVMDTATEAAKGRLTIRAWQDSDIGLRQPTAFGMGTPGV